MGDQYLTRPDADAHVVAGASTTETVGLAAQTGQASELGSEGSGALGGGQSQAPIGGTSAQAQATELGPIGEGAGGTTAEPPPAPAAPPTTVPYTVARNDTLWAIARRQYGHGDLWRAIYQANEDQLSRRSLHGGMHLNLPADLDAIINTCGHRSTVQAAFSYRWNVSVGRQAGAARIPIETFRRVHAQLEVLPPSHVEGTWRRLLHLNNSVGGYMSRTGGEFGMGEEAAAREARPYGQADLALTAEAAAGATTITLAATSLVGPGISVTLGTGDQAETVAITAVNSDRTVFTIDPALTCTHAVGAAVAATNNRARNVGWLEAMVRHEMGHAVHNRIGISTIQPFTEGLGGWHVVNTFDAWIGLMSNPWGTTNGQIITDAEKAQIKQVVERLPNQPRTNGLDNGLAADHAIIKYWDSGVPVIEAAKPMARYGSDYWKNSGEYYGQGGRFFTINTYYHEFHAFGAQLQYNQVRNYATFSPLEFFAEAYTVYYEEAANPNPDLGRLLPVTSWRTWITDNVHSRNLSPENMTTGGGGHIEPS